MKTPARWLMTATLLLGATSAWATPNLSLVASPFQSPGPGNDVVVAVAGNQMDGVSSMDLKYSYNPAVMTPTSVFRTGFTHGFALGSSLATPGIVEIHLSRPAALSGSGEFAWVTFRVAAGAAAGTTAPLTWISASMNGGALPCAEQGTNLKIAAAPVTISTPRNAFGTQGANITIPISTTTLAGGSSFDLVVTYDPNVLSAYSVSKTSFTQCMTMTSNISVPGTIRVSLYGLCNLQGAGKLVNVVFTVVGGNGARTPLNVTRGSIDEDQHPTVLEDGLFNTCGTPDADGDGYSVCAGDCNDANAAMHPDAVETCNGIDDDCDGVVDDAIRPAIVPSMGLVEANDATQLSWTAVSTATGYDVVRGDLSALLDPAEGFSHATDYCLANDSHVTNVVDGTRPTEGAGFWYLVRAGNCGGAGSFDDGGTSQAGSRDTGISASPFACP